MEEKKKGSWMIGKKRELSSVWKGDKAKYISQHSWIHNNYGKASKCVECGVIGKKRYEWANISGTYIRDISDYKEMCPSCHRLMDYARTGKCRKGHEMNESNVYIRPEGYKVCRTCQSEGEKRYRQNKKKIQTK